MIPGTTGGEGSGPLLGRMLGPCRIESLLGQGGMGTVYRAHHQALDKIVAVKVLAPSLAKDEEYVSRFVSEARAAAKLEHPNIVQVLNVDREDDTHFIILQYIEGESLEQVLQAKKKLDLKRATGIARDVAAGLAAAHREGIIHRDIKPANILLGKDGIAKITDFGLARNVRQLSGLTIEGFFLGSPHYVAPEQADGRTVDHRTDLYALGVTYYQMLSGSLPFEGNTPMDLAAKHLRDEPPPLSVVAPGVDPRAAGITKRLLQKNPRDRFSDAKELMEAFDKLLAAPSGVGSNIPASRVPPSIQPGTSRPARTVPPPRPAATLLAAQRRRRATRSAAFWGLTVLALGLFFVAGALGAPHRVDDFWMSLVSPFTVMDDGFLIRISVVVLAAVAFVVAFALDRGTLAVAAWPAASVAMFVLSGLCLYAGALHVSIAGEEGSLVERALSGVLEVWHDPSHLGMLAMAGLITGLWLGTPRAAGRVRRGMAGIVLAASLWLVLAFAALSGGTLAAPFQRISREVGPALAGLAGLASAGVGLFLVLGKREAGSKFFGIVLVSFSAVGVYSFAIPWAASQQELGESFVAPLLALPAAVAAHGGMLTLAAVFTGWGAWLLYSRSLRSRGYFS